MGPIENGILVLDFGSQYTLLIARRIREMGVYCEIWPFDDSKLTEHLSSGGIQAKGLILSGGPSSVNLPSAPTVTRELLRQDFPILGICYGMQLICHALGGEVEAGAQGEYGRMPISINQPDGLLDGFSKDQELTVWMSHGDTVTRLPEEFDVLASSRTGLTAAVQSRTRPLVGVQFHPEVTHTERGHDILANFVFKLAACEPNWDMGDFLQQSIESIRKQVKSDRVICGLSGGVDSTVVAALLARAIGDQVTCVFVDTGLMRAGESEQVVKLFENEFDVELRVINAADRFLSALAGVSEPELKRKIIGEHFVRVFEKVANEIDDARFLAQGTLYPDVIESVSVRGPSATIKTHHNVGGLPDDLGLELVEPLRELFKDEVRDLGRALGLSEAVIGRHPFPGPGLAVRILGEVTPERVETVRAADKIFIDGLYEEGLYDQVWQAFAVLLPVNTVGVMGDQRTYDQVIALRAVTSKDGMTADRSHLPHDFLGRMSDLIINRVTHINRVVYDVSSKPPATIEWE
jgi:GMP synthase (glutamine-hydrolysing)